jgi:iron complex transport system ATP-binding protein
MSALTVSDVSVVAGGQRILSDVSLRVAPGQCVAIVGPNGAGKSTLLKAILGTIKLASGHVRWGEQPLAKMAGRDRAAAVAWLPQHGLIQEAIPVIELVKAARFRFSEGRAFSLAAAAGALDSVAAGSLAQRSITTLSGGELQRIMMATLIAQDAAIFLLDEPANHLDPAHQIGFYDLICKQWTQGRGVVCITHDINLLTQLAPVDRAEDVQIVGLARGVAQFQTSLSDSGLGEKLSSLYGLAIATVERGGRRYFLAGAGS